MLHHSFAHDSDMSRCQDMMEAYGGLLAVEISAPKPLVDLLTKEGKAIPPAKTGYALIDTGAAVTVLHEKFVKELGVSPVGVNTMSTPSGGIQKSNAYPVHLKVPSHGLDSDLPQTITGDLDQFLTPEGEAIIGLIGRDFLSDYVLIYNGHLGMYTLAS